MVVIERMPGEGVWIGPFLVEVLSVNAEEVVIALHGLDEGCVRCGARTADRRRCPVCLTEQIVCPACAPHWRCPQCASST
jgi:hypothetical protein